LHILEDENGKLRREENEILVFSTGADGQSESNGNDPDDINSWDNHHHAFYHGQVDAAEFRERLWRTVWVTPLVIALISMLFSRFQKLNQLGRRPVA